MEQIMLNWRVGHTPAPHQAPEAFYPSTVPGSVQLDYARAHQWPPYTQGVNFKDYLWMEDQWWLYQAPLDFFLAPGQIAALIFKGIDYQYEIRVDGQVLHAGTGMFSPIRCDVTAFAGKKSLLEVLIWPIPKCDDSQCRDQARKSFKPCVPYGWDYHPRLVPMGIWEDAYLEIADAHSITALEASYRLSEDLAFCRIETEVMLHSKGEVLAELLDGDRVAAQACGRGAGKCTLTLELDQPKLWYPVGYGEQCRYTLRARAIRDGKITDERTRSIGFRRSRMVMNAGAWEAFDPFPKGRADAPATLEINGRRIFAKGTNWVNAQIFHGDMNEGNYRELLTLIRDANMNIVRIHGGGPVNKESFHDICDELGLMVWQEFPLACNEYPDEDEYLSVLKQDASAIIRRLRTHPSLVLWCGGNELFNRWSGMTEQHHALRLLGSLCYELDRFTPYNMTSPLKGMSHGHYVNYDEGDRKEFITVIRESGSTAYPEFGSPGMADLDYLRTFMDEADINDFRPENEVWRAHHAFGAWVGPTWARTPEAEYYFGGYTDIRDLCEKTRFIQAMGYRSLFEEMRKQWPHCSMALNWCFNEPWPTAANNSLVSWPAVPKPAYYAVQQALRPRMASLRIDRHLWHEGDVFRAGIWMLNDAPETMKGGKISVSYALGDGEYIQWGSLAFADLWEQTNACCGEMAFTLPMGFEGKIRIRLAVEEHGEMDSEYTYLCRTRWPSPTKRLLNF